MLTITIGYQIMMNSYKYYVNCVSNSRSTSINYPSSWEPSPDISINFSVSSFTGIFRNLTSTNGDEFLYCIRT